MKYLIHLADETEEHLRTLSSRQQSTVLDGIEKHLTHEPSIVTRNRKLMRPNPLAPWELRIGNLRVYSGNPRKKGRSFLSEGLMSWARAAIGEGEKTSFSKAEKPYKNNSREAIISPKG